MIPRSMIPALMAQPDEILSNSEYHRDQIEADYTLADPRVAGNNAVHVEVIRKALPRQVPVLIPDIVEEIKDSYDEFWGEDREGWKEIDLRKVMMKIVVRMSNRVLVGPTLCMMEAGHRSPPDSQEADDMRQAETKVF